MQLQPIIHHEDNKDDQRLQLKGKDPFSTFMGGENKQIHTEFFFFCSQVKSCYLFPAPPCIDSTELQEMLGGGWGKFLSEN